MIDDAPKPNDPETIAAEKVCEEMREIAKRLPKPDDAKNQKNIMPFGNNFFHLFLYSKGERAEKAERLYGEGWKKFLKDNADLIARIQEISKQALIYRELFERYTRLLINRKTRDLSSRIAQEINLDGIKNMILEKLNPLLKQASEAMVLAGIKPKDFYM